MRKSILLLLVLALVGTAMGNSEYKFLKPDKYGKSQKIQVKGKNWTYYRLDKKHPLEFIVEGPAEIKVITRLDMENYQKSRKVDYKIYCECNGDKTHYTRSAVWSKGVEFSPQGGGRLGAGETFIVKVKPGKQTVKLYLSDKESKQVYMRLLEKTEQFQPEVNRVAMHPQKFTKLVKILVKEKEFEYYRISNQDSLSLKIIGPATLKVLSRLEYNITMNGGKKYRVAVYEDGKLKNTFLFSTELSETAVYEKSNAELKLSRGDDFYLEVPEGEHIYTFKEQDSGRSILLKFYIPTSALDNTIR